METTGKRGKLVLAIFFQLITHRLNQSLKNQFFSIFGIFDHV